MRYQLTASSASRPLMRAMMFVALLAVYTAAQGSGHRYDCSCNIEEGASSCSCDTSTIVGQDTGNPYSIGPMATPEFDATCWGRDFSGVDATAFPKDPGLQLNWRSKSITCTVLDVDFCIANGQVCRDCTNWSFTTRHDVTIASIECIPYK